MHKFLLLTRFVVPALVIASFFGHSRGAGRSPALVRQLEVRKNRAVCARRVTRARVVAPRQAHDAKECLDDVRVNALPLPAAMCARASAAGTHPR